MLNTWSFLEKCLEVIKTFSKFAIGKLILFKRRGLSQIQTAFAIEANWRHRQDDDANRRKEKPRRCKLTKTINLQTDAINDANWRKYKNEIGAAFATDSLPHKTQNQKPNPKRSYWHTTEKLSLLAKPPTQGKGVHLSQVHQPSKQCTNRASSAQTEQAVHQPSKTIKTE